MYPSFIAADGAIMSETLFGLFVALAVLEALRLRERPNVPDAVGFGLVVGLAALTRSEGLLLLPLLALPALLRARGQRLALGGIATLVTLLILSPWVVRNWHHFHRPLLSNNSGTTLAGSNCRQTYYGDDIGWFALACVGTNATGSTSSNEAKNSARLARRGLDYAGDNVRRAVFVAGVRVARVWGLYQPNRQAVATGRRVWVQKIGVVVYYAVALLALLGIWTLRGRREELFILLAPILLVTLVTLGSWGSVRFRHEGEVVLIVLAGVALAHVWTLRGRRQT
jgi:4-amino-4-deoxy-L-arabinose transferase-like glycosyltransferase